MRLCVGVCHLLVLSSDEHTHSYSQLSGFVSRKLMAAEEKRWMVCSANTNLSSHLSSLSLFLSVSLPPNMFSPTCSAFSSLPPVHYCLFLKSWLFL